MRIGVLGTGIVGTTLASRFVEVGHDVVLGARSPTNEKAAGWAAGIAQRVAAGTFADAAAHGDVVVNATSGTASLAALELAGADALAGTVLLDVANPIASYGPPLRLDPVGDDSLAERIQRAFSAARVVKGLNTVTAEVMAHPDRLPEPTSIFLAGDHADAKQIVRELLTDVGWPAGSVLDVGGLVVARALEMYLPLWVALYRSTGDARFNIRVVR